jgi:hypothetical protein
VEGGSCLEEFVVFLKKFLIKKGVDNPISHLSKRGGLDLEASIQLKLLLYRRNIKSTLLQEISNVGDS